MQRLDKDKDGKLTKGEVPEGLWRRIARADADDDGTLSKDELKKARMAGRPGPRGTQWGRRGDGPRRDGAGKNKDVPGKKSDRDPGRRKSAKKKARGTDTHDQSKGDEA